MAQQAANATPADSAQKAAKYYIDEAWYELQNRSFQYMIQSRVEALEGPREKPAEKTTKRRGKVAPKLTGMEGLSKIEGFVHPGLSILEAVFRLLLVHQNKPMDAAEISQELAEHGIGVMDTRVVNPQSLTRMLDADFHYGIKRHPES